MDIIIDQEFMSLIPPLTNEEYTGLEKSLKEEGCRDALIVWKTDGKAVLVDGHNRYEICQKHGIEFRTIEKSFNDKNEAKAWVIRNQFSRRNLSAYDRSVLALKLKPLIAERAKEKQSEAGGAVRQKSDKAVIDTKKELAKIAGVSHDTIHKVEVIEKKAAPEVKEQLRNGEKTINKAWQEIKIAEMPEPKKPKDTVVDAKVNHKDYEEKKSHSVVGIDEKKEDKRNLPILYADITAKIVKADERLASVLADESYFKISLEDAVKYLDEQTYKQLIDSIGGIQDKIIRIKKEIRE